jgi:NADPH2:quinone reductase
MRAMRCHAFGPPETLVLDQAPIPQPGPGQVAIKVAAAGVNFADILMTGGQYQEKPPLPFSPGLEAAGTVTEVGEGVTGFALGERVLAMTDWGAFAEQAVARAGDVFAIPPEMDFATAAALSIAYGTAYGALTWRAELKPGETLLVHGATGGVGLAAVEVGRAMGATVIATASGPDKLALAKARGAHHVIDYRHEDVRARVKEICGGVDVAFDPVGGAAFEASLRVANWGARILIVGFAGGTVPQIPANILLVKNASAIGFYFGSYRRHRPELLPGTFAQLFAWYREGLIRPLVSERFPLDRAAEALLRLRDRRATGKIVLELG